MKAEIDALRDVLAPTGLETYWLKVPSSPAYPYRLLWQSTGRPLDERPLDNGTEAFTVLLGLTSVGVTPEVAREKASEARRILTPGGYPLELAVTGRLVDVEWSSFASAGEDRDVNVPRQGFAQFYVDLYRLTSLPI